jgi:ParB-like chromosome segregation protein Spo0J
MSALNKELAAEALIDAAFTTDEQACQKYGISTKTLQRYRVRLAEGDPELSGFVATKKAARDAAWAENLPGALAKGLQALESCFAAVQQDPESLKKPEVIHALAGAYRICAEVHITSRLIDARMKGRLLPSADAAKYPTASKYPM